MIRKNVYIVFKNSDILYVEQIDGYNSEMIQVIVNKKVKRISKSEIFAKCNDLKEAKKQKNLILKKMDKYKKKFVEESEAMGEIYMSINTFTEKVLMKLEFEKLEEILESKAKNERFREYCKQCYVNAINISKCAKDVNAYSIEFLNWNERCK